MVGGFYVEDGCVFLWGRGGFFFLGGRRLGEGGSVGRRGVFEV